MTIDEVHLKLQRYHLSSFLIERTVTLFISSNSSFSECTRKNALYPPLTTSDPMSITVKYDRRRISNSEHTYISTGRQTPSRTASFTSCSFRNLKFSGYSGGAIYFSGYSQATLTVTDSLFEHCEVKISQGNGHGGGAIYCSTISTVRISSSAFISCMCNTTNDSDGGAIELWIIVSQSTISGCTFIFCHSDDNGGALSVWNSGAADQLICKDSLFLSGTCEDCGGAIIFWNHNDIRKCSNTLFAHNKGVYGGAYANNILIQTQKYLFLFCFFIENSGSYGNDIFLSSLPSESPLLHCLSTSFEGKIVKGYDTWLPLGILSLNFDVRMRSE